MDFGDVWMALGIDFSVVQGAVNFMYKNDPEFQVVEKKDVYRLELLQPQIEARPPCGPVPYRMVLHLSGNLHIEGQNADLLFDAAVVLNPALAADADGNPVGVLSYGGIEGIQPAFARAELDAVFQPDGTVGKKLAGMELPVFGGLLDAATRVLHPPVDPDPDDDEEPPVTIDLNEFALAFSIGQPAPLRRPVYGVEDDDPFLDLDFSLLTTPALVATLALAGTDPVIPDQVSVVKPGTGLQLVMTKAMFDARLANEATETIGTESSGVTIDTLALEAVDGGIAVQGTGHKTGADVEFHGTVIALYRGRTDGRLAMLPAIHTDIDTSWWVDVLSVVAILGFGLFGFILVDMFVFMPKSAGPDKVRKALSEKFLEPLKKAADGVATAFKVKKIPSAAYLDDIWVFDGNYAVAAVALLGSNTATIERVTYDVAAVGPPPNVHTNRRRPVKSVHAVELSTGQSLTVPQVAKAVDVGLLEIPDHHVVHNVRALEGVYLRSDPNDTTSDNLIT